MRANKKRVALTGMELNGPGRISPEPVEDSEVQERFAITLELGKEEIFFLECLLLNIWKNTGSILTLGNLINPIIRAIMSWECRELIGLKNEREILDYMLRASREPKR